ILIRTMAPADIAPARALLSQLGYDMNAKEVKRRYEAIKEKHDHAVFVGEEDGRVVALLHLCELPAFDKPPDGTDRFLGCTCRRTDLQGKWNGAGITAESERVRA